MKGSEEKENVGNTKMPPSNHHRPHRIHHNKWAKSKHHQVLYKMDKYHENYNKNDVHRT